MFIWKTHVELYLTRIRELVKKPDMLRRFLFSDASGDVPVKEDVFKRLKIPCLKTRRSYDVLYQVSRHILTRNVKNVLGKIVNVVAVYSTSALIL